MLQLLMVGHQIPISCSSRSGTTNTNQGVKSKLDCKDEYVLRKKGNNSNEMNMKKKESMSKMFDGVD